MALDIEIDYGNIESPYWLQLEFSEFNILVDVIKGQNNFPLLKRCLSNYFGDNEVYLNELNDLKSEVVELKKILGIPNSDTTTIFVNNFFELIENAIKQRKTIKLIGD